MRFRTRIALAFVVMSTFVVAAAFWGFRFELRQALIRSDRVLLRARARRVAKRYRAGHELAAGDPTMGVAIFSTDGVLIAERPGESPLPEISRQLIEKSVERVGRATTDTLPGRDGGEVRVLYECFLPRRTGSDAGGGLVVLTYRDLDSIDARTNAETVEVVWKVLPLALGVGLLAAWLLSRSLVRPLAAIAEQAESAASPTSVSVVSGSGAGDELDVLADVLNATFQRLREAFERQSRFTSDAAHELRTPVAAVLGRAEVALRRERTAEEYRAALADVRDVAQRAAGTVEGLLHLTRLDAGDEIRAGAVDVCAVLVREVDAARERHGASSDQLRLELASPSCSVRGDEALLCMLTRNLLDNALTHGQSDGGVDVRLLREHGEATLIVRDVGVGIPPDHLAPVFDRLHRVDAARSRSLGGAGLGLSIVRAVAEAHGGTATLTSAPGAGTTVTVQLPALA